MNRMTRPNPSTLGGEKLRLLFLSTPVAPLGSGEGGGVELCLENLCRILLRRGHSVDLVAPQGSRFNEATKLITPGGSLETKAQTLASAETGGPGQAESRPHDLAAARSRSGTGEERSGTDGERSETVPPGRKAGAGGSHRSGSFLHRMCRLAAETSDEYDRVVNFAYDLEALRLTYELPRKLLHLISMGCLYEEFDREIGRIDDLLPGRLACYSRTQAETFSRPDAFRPLGSGLDLERYRFRERPDDYLLWLGRISPEKAPEDALEVARRSGLRLILAGKMEDRAYWEKICRPHRRTRFEYAGFLSTEELQKLTGGARALLMTPRWVEAFGMVAIEALACGVPVISYRRGGPAEIVRDGETGFLTPPDSIDGLLEAVGRIDRIDRRRCRRSAEEEYSLDAWADRHESWYRTPLEPGPEER